ncbi:MAG: hypothetical protein ACI4F7_10230 [Acutalibacteraceae bacterium]
MRKGKVLSLKNLHLADFFTRNNSLLVPVIFVCAGIVAGVFAEGRVALLSDFSESYVARFTALRIDASFISVALDSFMSAELFLLCVFAAGTSMLGVVLVPLAAALRGLLYGGVSAFLYSQYAVKGIAFNAVLIIPSAFVFVIALLLASRESVRFSLLIARMSLPATPAVNLSYDFKNYCGRYLFISLIALASALTDAALSCSFIGGLKL